MELEFWAFGSEGEAVAVLLDDFHSAEPGIRVSVQQIPWSAAHEKLLTAFAGDRLPDICQLGNTWIPEFVALGALHDLTQLTEQSPIVRSDDHFAGIWDTNLINHRLYGVPWYVDTRLLFYRHDLMRECGIADVPRTWDSWRTAMIALRERFGIAPLLLPLGEWEPIVILGLQQETPLLREQGRFGNFESDDFNEAFAFYAGLFESGLAPKVGTAEIANVWDELADGNHAMYISGPWNISAFRKRLSAKQLSGWSTAALPGPTAATGRSTAGGCSLVIFRSSNKQPAAWKLIEYLSRPETQVRFFQLVGDLPAHRQAWTQAPLTEDPWIEGFKQQLEKSRALPKVPEWERIATKVAAAAERAVRTPARPSQILADLNGEIDAILRKRRWMLDRETRVVAAELTSSATQ